MRPTSWISNATRGAKPAASAAAATASRIVAPSWKTTNGSSRSSRSSIRLRPARRWAGGSTATSGSLASGLEREPLAPGGRQLRQQRDVERAGAEVVGEVGAETLANRQLDRRVRAVEAAQQRQQVERAGRLRDADREAAGEQAGQLLQLGAGGVQLRQHAAGAGDERLAGAGQRDAAGRPLDQRRPQLPLELADLLRQRRLRDVAAQRGAREVALVGERDEVAQLPQFHSESL